MARIVPDIPRHIVQRGDRRHGSRNECGVPGIPGGEGGKKRKKLRPLIRPLIELDAIGWLPYDTAKDLFYRALRERRCRPVLVNFPALAKDISPGESEARFEKARVLGRGEKIKGKVKRGKLKGLEIKIRNGDALK